MKTFTVSVSRMAKGKAGYERDKYRFGWSFYPEQHNIESLIRLAAIDGYSFLAGEFARKHPSHYGRDDVCTARISENFIKTYIIPLDDDGDAGNAVTFWENDRLFQTFGAGYYHTTRSTGDKPRIRPIFELDRAITDRNLYQEIRQGFRWYYPRIDGLIQIPQVFYGCDSPHWYKILGKVLPLEVLERVVLLPYREMKRREVEARQKSTMSTSGHSADGDDVNRILAWFASRQPGDCRNTCLLWVGSQLKALGESWQTVGQAVIEASKANGYYFDYAKSDREIERIFSRGVAR